jgi:hypothetical protein
MPVPMAWTKVYYCGVLQWVSNAGSWQHKRLTSSAKHVGEPPEACDSKNIASNLGHLLQCAWPVHVLCTPTRSIACTAATLTTHNVDKMQTPLLNVLEILITSNGRLTACLSSVRPPKTRVGSHLRIQTCFIAVEVVQDSQTAECAQRVHSNEMHHKLAATITRQHNIQVAT